MNTSSAASSTTATAHWLGLTKKELNKRFALIGLYF